MSTATRRRLLGTAATALAGGLAGCAGLDGATLGGATHSTLGEVTVSNRDDRPHTVHLLVREGGDPVYWRSLRVEATDPDETYQGAQVVAGGEFEGLPQGPGAYVLTVRVDDQPEGRWASYDTRDDPAECIGVAIDIAGSGPDRGEPVILTTNNQRVCDGVPTTGG